MFLYGNEVKVMKCLVVDDDNLDHTLIQNYVSTSCEDIIVAGDGREAVDAFKAALDEESPFDLIVLDVVMPAMDGLQTLRAIRELEATRGILHLDGVKVIMTTALRDAKHVLGAYQMGCEAYLLKPVKKEDLMAEIDKLGLT